MSIYQELILQHYRSPQNTGNLSDFTSSVDVNNPLCGDSIHLEVKLEDGKIQDIKFQGNGCAISQAAASLLFEEIKGKTKEDVMALDKDSVLELLGIELSPIRLKCALLPLEAVKKALINIDGR